jgi:GDPmannose 4,6-dehydratase
MKRALVTGISGQDGTYLAQLLLAEGYEVFGLVREPDNPALSAVKELLDGVSFVTGDLTDVGSLLRAIEECAPTEVYNLAAVSHVAYSWKNAGLTTDVTGKGVLNILEAIRSAEGSSPGSIRFYQASSSEMFGKALTSPQNEVTAFWPRSPYGVAKAFGHYITINYRESYGMHASNGILFNHESPRRRIEFVTRKIARGVARIHAGLDAGLVLGNLDARRDWGYAPDYVRAMWLMLQQPQGDDFVIATGKSHSIRDFVELAFANVGIRDWEHYVSIDDSLLRPADIDMLVGDASKAKRILGWEPTKTFEEIVELMVRHEIDELGTVA